MNRKTVNAWCLYDFGNSAFAVIFVTVFGAYYSDAVVGEARGDRLWGYIGSISMGLVALSAPLMGGIADHAGVRKRMLAIYTTIAIITTLCFSFIHEGSVWLGFALGILANFAFEGGTVFYNSYLPVIAPPSHQGRVSARGFAVGYAGSLLTLGVGAWLALQGNFTGVWLTVGIVWVIGATPAFLFLPRDEPTGMSVPAAAARGVKQTLDTWKDVLGMRNMRRFLLAYFFYMDGVNTIIFFAAVYATKEIGMEIGESTALFAMVQLTALVGSILMAGPCDRNGPRWAVLRTLIWWIFVVALAMITGTPTLSWSREAFWLVAGLAGLGLGSIQASSRALMSHLVPSGREAEFFGFYALCGKTGAVIGPALLVWVSDWIGSLRLALITVVISCLIGLFFLMRVRDPQSDSSSTFQ